MARRRNPVPGTSLISSRIVRPIPEPLTDEQRKAKYLKPANPTQRFYPHLAEGEEKEWGAL
jgi:hypothetical protein